MFPADLADFFCVDLSNLQEKKKLGQMKRKPG